VTYNDDVDKIMPGSGKRADAPYMRIHTSLRNQSRPSGKTVPTGF
jgi:hypothetical protein